MSHCEFEHHLREIKRRIMTNDLPQTIFYVNYVLRRLRAEDERGTSKQLEEETQ